MTTPATPHDAILRALKREPAAAADLAAALGVTPTAVRQHLRVLEGEGLVRFTSARQPVGRPRKVYDLTPAAAERFPDSHAELTRGLLDATRTALGDEGLQAVLKARANQQVAAYRSEIDRAAPLADRVRALAELRAGEGYLATSAADPEGGHLLIEGHCPIRAAADACPGLCQVELEVFRRVLGRAARVERTEHLLDGDRRCAYRITDRSH